MNEINRRDVLKLAAASLYLPIPKDLLIREERPLHWQFNQLTYPATMWGKPTETYVIETYCTAGEPYQSVTVDVHDGLDPTLPGPAGSVGAPRDPGGQPPNTVWRVFQEFEDQPAGGWGPQWPQVSFHDMHWCYRETISRKVEPSVWTDVLLLNLDLYKALIFWTAYAACLTETQVPASLLEDPIGRAIGATQDVLEPYWRRVREELLRGES